MTEDHPTFPCTVYGASKLAGECYTRAFHSTYGYATVVVRPFNAYGPRCHHEGDSGEVIPKFMLRVPGRPAAGRLRRRTADARLQLRRRTPRAGILAAGVRRRASARRSTSAAARRCRLTSLAGLVPQVVGPNADRSSIRTSRVPATCSGSARTQPKPSSLLGFKPRVDAARKACGGCSTGIARGRRRRMSCCGTRSSATGSPGSGGMTARPIIPVARPWLDEREAEAARRAILSGWVTQGPEVAAFEREFAAAVGAPHACAVSSCTTALHLALVALGVGPGDEVVTVSHSFIATANAVRYCGADAGVRGRRAGHVQHRSRAASRLRVTPRTRAILCRAPARHAVRPGGSCRWPRRARPAGGRGCGVRHRQRRCAGGTTGSASAGPTATSPASRFTRGSCCPRATAGC